jgi:hypothetical protein
LTFDNNTESGLFCLEVKLDSRTPIGVKYEEELNQSEQKLKSNSNVPVVNTLMGNFSNSTSNINTKNETVNASK